MRLITDEAEAIQLGIKLGYEYLANDHTKHMPPLTDFILPVDAFTIRDDGMVEIRELILDDEGFSISDNGNRLTRTVVRPIPA